MIKFFRKIRQRLLAEIRFNKYVLYAIGEIVLVVIGILIALQINNWNEERKTRRQEVKYLKNLHKDISLEFVNNDSIIRYRAQTAKEAANMLNLKELKTEEDLLELEKLIQKVFRRVNFIPTNNTYKELLSSGNLNFITNDTIKEYLLNLDKEYREIANVEYQMYREYEEYLYNPAVRNSEIINLFDLQKTADKEVLMFKNPSEINVEIINPQYNKLLQIGEFKNGLKLSVMNNVSLKKFHDKLALNLHKLIALIEKEIERN